MIIEFELQGSKKLHKGIFDTNGFWCQFEPDFEEIRVHQEGDVEEIINGYKLFSHFSFSFYHTDKETVLEVYKRLISVIKGANNAEIEGVGYIRKLNKS